jgi:hypothetical protein
MPRIPVLLIIVVAVTLAGCVQTSATMLSSKKYPPITPEEVIIYLDEDDIPGEFERVAILNASGNTGSTTERQMHEALRKRAAVIGANGILYREVQEPSTGAKVAGAVFGVGTNRRAEMVAIYVFPQR